MFNNIRVITPEELTKLLQTGDLSSIFGQETPKNDAKTCHCGHCNGVHSTETPAQPAPKPAKPETKTQTVGSIFTEDSLSQAIKTNDADIVELQRQIEAKQRANEQYRVKMQEMANQTKMVRQGSDIAITMTRENAVALVQSIATLLQKNQSQNITFNIGNVR